MAENEKILSAEAEAAELSEQTRIRREKLAALQEEGRDPYKKVRYPRTHLSAEIIENYESLEGKTVSIAGRMTIRRIMGKASFAKFVDGAGILQAYVARDDVGEDEYARFKKCDIGDIFGLTGRASSSCPNPSCPCPKNTTVLPTPICATARGTSIS